MKITLFEKETHDHRYHFDLDSSSPLDEDLLAPVLYDKDQAMADSTEMNDVLANSTANNTENLLELLSNGSGTPRDLNDDYNDYDYFNIEDRATRILQEPDKIVAIILVFVAITANIFSLIVMCKILRNTRGPASHTALIFSLAASDVLFCLTVLLHIVNKILNPLHYPGFGPWDERLASRCAYTIIKSLNTTALNVNLLNLMGMAIEHYIAILKPLHHTRLLSRKKYTVMILLLWIIAFVFGFSDFIYVFKDWKDWHLYKDKFNLCEFVYISEYHEEYTVLATAFLCLVIMLYVYVRIYKEALRHQRREQPADNFTGSQKALVTTLLILGTFMLCWLPMCIFQLVLIIQVHVNPGAVRNLLVILVNADQHLYNLLLLNALLDPIIYAVRIREIRHNYIELLRKICLCIYIKCKARDSPEDCHYVSVNTSGRRMSRRPSCTPSLTDMDRRMSRVSAGLAPGLPGVTTINPAELTQLQPVSSENEPEESAI